MKSKTNTYLWKRAQQFLADEDGPTSVEYAMMLAMIIVGTIGAILTTGDLQQAMFFDVADELNSATQGN